MVKVEALASPPKLPRIGFMPAAAIRIPDNIKTPYLEDINAMFYGIDKPSGD